MGFFAASILEFFIKVISFSIKSVLRTLRFPAAGKWPATEAVVTGDPTLLNGIAGQAVEFPYSYRVEGELYTGLHEEPCFDSASECIDRFAKGRRIVVRVKPGAPEISLVRDKDQADGLKRRLDEIDRQHGFRK